MAWPVGWSELWLHQLRGAISPSQLRRPHHNVAALKEESEGAGTSAIGCNRCNGKSAWRPGGWYEWVVRVGGTGGWYDGIRGKVRARRPSFTTAMHSQKGAFVPE